MSRDEKAIALIVVILWIVLFTAGILVNTTPYRNLITYRMWALPTAQLEEKNLSFNTPPTESDHVIAWPIVLLLYSVPNLLYLCVLASMAGAILRRANKARESGAITDTLAGSALVAFLLYLSFIAGLVTIASANEFVAPNQDTYLRRAPVLSVVCFMLTYEPKLFAILIARLGKFTEATISRVDSSENSKEAESASLNDSK